MPFQYDMEDMRETDWKQEFNVMWQQWRKAKADRDKAMAALRAIEQKAQQRTLSWSGAVDHLLDCKAIAGKALAELTTAEDIRG